MLVVFDKLNLLEPQIAKVLTLHFVGKVVERGCRGYKVLLFELVVRRNVRVPNLLLVLLMRIGSLKLNHLCFISC